MDPIDALRCDKCQQLAALIPTRPDLYLCDCCAECQNCTICGVVFPNNHQCQHDVCEDCECPKCESEEKSEEHPSQEFFEEQLKLLMDYLGGFRSFECPDLDTGMSVEEQISLLMISSAEQEYFCGWCPGNRKFYDADEMTDCEGCDELFSREHLVTVGVGEQAFLYCENCAPVALADEEEDASQETDSDQLAAKPFGVSVNDEATEKDEKLLRRFETFEAAQKYYDSLMKERHNYDWELITIFHVEERQPDQVHKNHNLPCWSREDEMEQACEDGTAFDFCMNGCDDKKKKIIYELKEPGGSDIWWYCEDCADAKEIESGYLNHFAARFDKEESSPEPSQETTESSQETTEPTA